MENIFTWISVGIGIFSIIATVTPNEADNEILDNILKTINLFGMNFGKSKNEVD